MLSLIHSFPGVITICTSSINELIVNLKPVKSSDTVLFWQCLKTKFYTAIFFLKKYMDHLIDTMGKLLEYLNDLQEIYEEQQPGWYLTAKVLGYHGYCFG